MPALGSRSPRSWREQLVIQQMASRARPCPLCRSPTPPGCRLDASGSFLQHSLACPRPPGPHSCRNPRPGDCLSASRALGPRLLVTFPGSASISRSPPAFFPSSPGHFVTEPIVQLTVVCLFLKVVCDRLHLEFTVSGGLWRGSLVSLF